jgi:hypothetical protein
MVTNVVVSGADDKEPAILVYYDLVITFNVFSPKPLVV